MCKFTQLTLLFLFSFSALAAKVTGDELWQDVNTSTNIQPYLAKSTEVLPKKYRLVSLNIPAMQAQLSITPSEHNQALRKSQSVITLPFPNGSLRTFRITESSVMAPELAAKFPELKTYQGEAIDDPSITVRFDWTVAGFHAMILNGSEVIYVDPYTQGDTQRYINYYKRDAQPIPRHQIIPDVIDNKSRQKLNLNMRSTTVAARSAGAMLRTYRIAVATTGEYTQFFGGTKAAGLSAVVTAINRVTGIYEKEIAIRLQLVGNNDLLIYTNSSTDPYSNFKDSSLLNENQTNLDRVIGRANYDIGHVFGTGGGGLANLGVVCDDSYKATGETGSKNPSGDAFWVDFVAHEMGHQLGANHTFNSPNGNCSGNTELGSQYEIGSGTTIMGYAGICEPDDVQQNSDPYFHSHSFSEIRDYVTTGVGSDCGTVLATGNTPPTVNQGASGVTIPRQTPFMLSGSGSDADGDTLTYSWEEYDLGKEMSLAKTKAANNPLGNLGTVPLFRALSPLTSPNRYLPKYSNILNNIASKAELLPNYARQLKFRLTARDNRGGVSVSDLKTFNVTDQAGPFTVSYPTNGITWKTGHNTAIVRWNVAKTNLAPVNCSAVNIDLDTDSSTFSLLKKTPNDGLEILDIPAILTNKGRIKVSCANNLFFDLSSNNITVTNPTTPDFMLQAAYGTQTGTAVGKIFCNIPLSAENIPLAVGSVANFSNPVRLSYLNLPTAFNGSFSVNSMSSPYTKTATARFTVPSTLAAQSYAFQIQASAADASPKRVNVEIGIASTLLKSPSDGVKLASLRPTLSWLSVVNAESYILEVATDSVFTNIVKSVSVKGTEYALTSDLESNKTYYWRVKTVNGCNKAITTSSLTRSFITPTITSSSFCSTPMKSDVALISDSLILSGTQTIKDVNVLVQLQHPYIGDVNITLTHVASDKTIELMPMLNDTAQTIYSCSNINVNTTFDDESTTILTCDNSTGGGTRQPSQFLSLFDGDTLGGEWRLDINDTYTASDKGTLQKWCLNTSL